MARLIERNFDPAKPVFARKKFTANGQRFSGGKAFDWRKMAISERRAKQLFDGGHIGHEAPVPAPDPTPTPITPERIKPEYTPERINEEPTPITPETPLAAAGDDLDAIDDMKELRAIADEIGAGYKVSKADQREAIRKKRAE